MSVEWKPGKYDAWYETKFGRVADRLEKEAVFSMLGGGPGQVALDAGCGTGNFSVELSKRGFCAYGVDKSPNMTMRSLERSVDAGLPAKFVTADMRKLPFIDNFFDVAIAITSLCFVEDEERALLELKRVLKPGGRLVVGALNSRSTFVVLKRIKRALMDSSYKGARFHSPRSLKTRLMGAGFEVKAIDTCVFFPPLGLFAREGSARFFEEWGRAFSPKRGAFISALAIKN